MSNQIEVIGLGSGTIDQLPYGLYKKITATKGIIYTRTMDHPVLTSLIEEGIRFRSFDEMYEKHHQFEHVYTDIVKVLVNEAKKRKVVYTVPGHPMVAEKTVELLLQQKDVDVHIVGGQSFLDDLWTALNIDPIDGFQLIDATAFKRSDLTYQQHTVFCQVYDQMVASEVKLALLEDLPASFEVTVVTAAGTSEEAIETLKVEELDRNVQPSNLMIIYVPPVPGDLLHHQFDTLRQVISMLRGPDGCPWDKKQTHESLRSYAIEEVYELIEAIDQQDDEAIIAELGDVLLQIMLHSQIGEDAGYFTIEDVIKSTTEKMIRRHPHVFEEEVYGSEEEMRVRWEEIKKSEKGSTDEYEAFFASVPNGLPALMRSKEIQKKAVHVGFDWEDVKDIWDKLTEEVQEAKEAIALNNFDAMEDEFGDVLFVLVNIMRYYSVHPELALHRANEKFMSRFSYIEQALRHENKQVTDATDTRLDQLWNEAKEKEKKHETR